MRYIKSFILMSLVILSGCVRRKAQQIFSAPEIENNAFFDANPTSTKASYLYAPGLMGSELIMGRYCPEFVASASGEKISWKVGGHVIGHPHTAVIFPEVDLEKPTNFTMNPLKAMVNKVRREVYPLAQRFMYEKYGICVIDNPASRYTVVNYGFNFSRGNIAQKQDINAIQKSYAQHNALYPDTDVILYGDSRGASTIFNFIAINKPAHVKAAVLEGGFDAMPHVMKHCIFSDKEQNTEKRLTQTLSFVMRSYKKDALSPRQYAEQITDDIPLLFVTSLKDAIVPSQCTFALYSRLKERDFKKIHILVLHYSTHPAYMLDDARDRELYESVVHAFYKQYNLPYNQAKAAAGQEAFARTQPSAAELKASYPLAQCESCL